MSTVQERIRFSWVELDNGETIAFRQSGKGDTVLILVHGNTGSSKHWDLLMRNLPDEYSVYAPDLRGFGDSTYAEKADSISDYAQDLLLFTESLGLKSFVLAGWSLGGAVCMRFAIDHPKMVEKLILMASADIKGYPANKRGFLKRPIQGKYITSREELYEDLKAMIKAMERRTDWIIRTALDFSLFNVSRPQREQREELIKVVFQQRNLLDVNYALIHFNISHEHNGITQGTGEVDQLTMPVLVLQGDRDMVVNTGIAESIVEGIGENARLVVLAGCGHFPVLDNLEAVTREFVSFIEDHSHESRRRIRIPGKATPVLERLSCRLRKLNPFRAKVELP